MSSSYPLLVPHAHIVNLATGGAAWAASFPPALCLAVRAAAAGGFAAFVL
jgi:hypothetical protein